MKKFYTLSIHLFLMCCIMGQSQPGFVHDLFIGSSQNPLPETEELKIDSEGSNPDDFFDESGNSPMEICLTCPSYDYFITPASAWQIHFSSIVSNGCRMYILYIAQGNTYTFKTGCGDGATAAFDTYLELYNDGCTQVAYDDDGCESARSKITWTATYSGYAYLKVRGYNSSYYGNYTLAYSASFICKPCPEYDFTVTPGAAWQTHNSSIVSNGCKIYRFSAITGYQYTFKTGCGDGASAAFDTYMELSNSSCSVISFNDDGCTPTQSIITWTADYSGDAFIEVRGYGSSHYGNFSLAYQGIAPITCLTCPSFDYSITATASFQTHSSSIVSDGCRIYKLSVTSGNTYTFKTGCGDGASATFDTYLELFNGSCSPITYDDDGCAPTQSIITWTADYTGDAYLKIKGYASLNYGTYTLAYNETVPIICLTCPSYDFTLTPTDVFQTHTSSIVSNGCKMYRIDLLEGYEYTFKTGCGDGAVTAFDTYLTLYNSSCVVIGEDDDNCENYTSAINYLASFSGPAYLKVNGFGSDNFGDYTLAYNATPPIICQECPGYDFSITPTESFQTHTSSIVSEGCKIYSFYATTGYTYTFKTGCGEGADCEFDSKLELYSDCNTIIMTDDDGCPPTQSIITWTADQTGPIFIKVSGYSFLHYGSYTLAFNLTEPICKTCPNSNFPITLNDVWQTHSSSIVSDGCKIYSINVTSGFDFTFKTGCDDGASTDFDTYLELYNTNCELLHSDDDGCSNSSSILIWTASYTGIAFLKVSGFDSNSYGNYALAYKKEPPCLCGSNDFTITPSASYQTHSSSLVSNGCNNYRINVIEGLEYTFKTGCGDGAVAGFDNYLELSRVQCGIYPGSWVCDLITSSNDVCENNTSILIWTADFTGSPELTVKGLTATDFGNYTLAYKAINPICTTCPVFDFSITPTECFQTHSSSILNGGCKIYSLNVTEGFKYVFKTGCGDGATADFGNSIYPYDNICNPIIYDYINCENSTYLCIWTSDYTGTAFIKVVGGSTNPDFGSYTLAYRKISPEICKICPEYDFNITPTAEFQTHSSSIENFGCKIYSFNATQGYEYTFKTGCGDGATASFDTYLQLYSSSCLLSSYNDNGCENNLSTLTWVADYDEVVYLTLKEPGVISQSGNYTLAYKKNIPVCMTNPDYNFSISPTISYQIHTSSILSDGCKIYKVHVNKGFIYTFKTGCGDGANAGFDTYLELINPNNGSVITSNDDGCESNHSIITWEADNANFIILKVRGKNNSSFGSYTLAYKGIDPVCRICPDYDFSLEIDDIYNGSYGYHSWYLEEGGCKIYKFEITQGSEYTFKTGCGAGATATFDTYLELFDNNCSQLTHNDNGCENNRSLLSWVAGYSGAVFLKIRGANSMQYGFYTLAYHKNISNCTTIPDYDFLITPNISYQTHNSDIINNGCKIYKFYANEGYGYTFKTGCGDGANADFDTYLNLMDSNTNSFLYNDNGCESNRSIIGWVAPHSGTYFIKLCGDNNTQYGNYTLAYNVIQQVACNACPDYDFSIIPTDIFQTHTSTVGYLECKIYSIEVSEGTEYTFKTGCGDGATATFNTYLVLFDSNCSIISSTWDGCENNRSIIEYEANYTGTVYLKVQSGPDFLSYGTYTLAYKRNNPTLCQTCLNFDFSLTPRLQFQMHTSCISGNGCKFYKLDVTAGNIYTFKTGCGHCATADFDTYLELFNNNCYQIAFDDNGCDNSTSSIIWTADYTGPAFLKVSGVGTVTNCLEYDLAYNVSNPAICKSCPDYDFLIHFVVQYPKKHSSAIVDDGCKIYTFDVVEGREYSFKVEPITSTFIELYKNNCIEIINNACVFTLCEIVWTADYTGRAFLKVFRRGNPISWDYTLTYFNSSNAWTGLISSDWFTPGNWSTGKIPGPGINAIIPQDCLHEPAINGAKASCRCVTILPGANLTIGNDTLEAFCDISGILTMTDENSVLIGNVIWRAGSNDNITAGNIICSQWTFLDGTNAKLGSGSNVIMNGEFAKMSIFDSDAELGNLAINSPNEGALNMIDQQGDSPIRVTGDFCLIGTWHINYADLIVSGNVTIYFPLFWQSIGSVNIYDSNLDVSGSFTMDVGYHLGLFTGSNAIIHSEIGYLDLGLADGTTFICDYSPPSGSIELGGKIEQSGSSLLEFTNSNIIAHNLKNQGGTLRFGGSLDAPDFNTVQISNAVTEFINGNAGNHVNIANGNFFDDVTVKKPGGSITLLNKLILSGDLILDQGDFNLNGQKCWVGENISVNPATQLNIDDNAKLLVGNGKSITVKNSGKLNVDGSPGAEASISPLSIGFYDINIESGGTIGAQDGLFESNGTSGINIKPGALVDPITSFHNCTFQNGASGGRLLTIDNDQEFSVYEANFPENTWNGAYNVYKSVDNGHVTFIGATGDFAGAAFEYDPYNRIDWVDGILTADPLIRYVNPTTGITTFNISSNLAWTVSENSDWFSVYPMSGSNNGTITVTYDQNSSQNDRVDTITLSAMGAPDLILTVNQYGLNLSVSPATQNVGPDFGITAFVVTSTVPWSVSENVSWFSAFPLSGSGNGTINVEYSENTFLIPRSGQITISATGLPNVVVTVTQAGAVPFLLVTPLNRDVSDPAGTTTFSVTSNTSWAVSESVSWFSVLPISGIGNGPLTVSFDENTSIIPRSGQITVSAAGVPDVVVTVSQAGAAPILSVSPPNRDVSAPAGMTTFSITSNTSWTVTENVSWFSVLTMNGNGNGTLTVNYDENTSVMLRSGQITVSAAGVPDVVVTVNQAGAAPTLSATPSIRDVAASAGSTTFDINSNTNWTVSESADWFSVLPMNGNGNATLTVNYDENISVTPRSGQITVSAAGVPDVVVTVNQAGAAPTLSVTPFIRDIAASAGSTTFDINSNTNWTVSESAFWFSVLPMNGNGNATLTVNYEENTSVTPRSEQITVSAAGVPDVVVTVNQAGAAPTLSATPSIRDIAASAGSTTFDINSNTNWTVSESAFWFSVLPMNGNGNATLTVNYEENTSVTPRSGQITLSAAGTPDVVVMVNQAGAAPILSVSPPNRDVSAPAGTTTFSVTSNTSWAVSESVSWFSVLPMSGNWNGTLTVTYDENTSVTPRSGQITISATGAPDVVVTVNQAGAAPILSVSPSNRDVSAPAGTTTFSVTSNTLWTVSESVSWFSLLPMSGSGNGTLTVNYSENTSVTPRSGQITLSAAGAPDVVVTVNQAGAAPFLVITPSIQNVTPAGNSVDFEVSSNIIWNANENVSWLNVQPAMGNGDLTITVNYEENSSGATRSGEITVTAERGTPSVTISLIQTSFPVHSISLTEGWSGLSSYLMPAETNLPLLTAPIAANLIILQTLSGIYYPSGGINTIGPWASQSAYSVKMNAASTFPVSGIPEVEKTFVLSSGWNLIPVICNSNVNTSTLVGSLGANLQIIKEIAGTKLYWPSFGIYSLDQLIPGKAYFIRMAAAGSVTFPDNGADIGYVYDKPFTEPETPWNIIHRTAASHIIGIDALAMAGLEEGDIIGVFTPDGLCAGNSQIGNLNENLALYAFADDQLTLETDGFTDGQPLIFKLFRPSTGEEFNMEVIYNIGMPNNDGLFAAEGISVITQITQKNTGLTENFARGLYIYPNPTNGKVTIGGIEGIEQILVVRTDGTSVITHIPQTQGIQKIDLAGVPSGVYQICIQTNQGMITRKVVKGR